MSAASVVAGDWGTSSLRLFLCDTEGEVLERRTGPGAAQARGEFSQVFRSLTAEWIGANGPLPAVLCGMVGSNIGWVEAPYVRCPARPEQIAAAVAHAGDGSIHIAPGLICRNRFGAPDVLRGEETQVLGVLQRVPTLRSGRHLLCLPGTHTKWVSIEDGIIRDFFTAPTGELFTLLRLHSVLVSNRSEAQIDSAAFEAGLSQVKRFPRAQWLHRAFESRSRRVSGELAEDAAAGFQSGLLIGSDVGGALQLLEEHADAKPVQLIGEPRLTNLYSKALGSHRRASQAHDGEASSLAGLHALYRLLRTEPQRGH